jgi:eukaryotic-like serine/threonine-protein kinase
MHREPAPARSTDALPARLADWKGTDRYDVRRCIGTGSMGAVYEAFDRERRQPVALKKLRHFSPAALYLFKQEFRTLADVHHPNLVRLYELVATDAHDVFFTMELVRGTELLAHVRGGGNAFDALRAALRQLVEGVEALHSAGILHRDIKPSNVLVTSEGRVVLLDFGVATEVPRLGDDNLREEHPIVGTAAYMAPEQASRAPPTPASDWYSVGAILFEALVGSAPFIGSVTDVLRMKSTVDPPPPSRCTKDVPPDLDALCSALLQRGADTRPSGPEILRWLGVRKSDHAPASRASPAEASRTPTLVGREEHLSALHDAFAASRAGRSITVLVGGPSGVGKSTLVHDFLEDLATRGEAVVLRGRAYERESVPYKAIDSWVDALSRHLLRLSDLGAQIALPADAWALARLFPVLRRVPEIGDQREQVFADPHGVRRRAFGALRELLASLAQRQPTVVYIDDAHWGDADSAALLLDLVRPPNAPPLLLVMTYRGEEAETSSFLSEIRAHWPPAAEAREIAVGPLDPEDARRLALALLVSEDPAAQATARAVARESQGSPFLVEELVRSYQSQAQSQAPGIPITLEQSVGERVSRLPEATQRMLEMVAVSGRPLPVSTVRDATGVAEGVDDAMALLSARRLVHVGLRNGHEVVETIHDRIGSAIVSRLSADVVREHHGRLARVLEATPGADPEAVALHLLGAGEKDRAGPYAERAAEQAMTKLAFDRAIQLFRLALECPPDSLPNPRRVRVRLAEALAWAGRGAEAARAYLEAAERVPGLERVELERAAAEQLLASGRIDEGAIVLHRVLAAIGVKAPRSMLSALFWLLVYRLWGAVIGLRFHRRLPQDVRKEDRVRIDAMYAVAMGFAIVDVLLGACMQARHLIFALRAGDDLQILRATSLEASHLASLGGREGKRERALNRVASELAERGGGAEGEAFFEGIRGIGLFLRGHWNEARGMFETSGARLAHGHAHWQVNGLLFAARSLYFSGDIKELTRRQARMSADAQDRGDLYTAVNLGATTLITTHLAADDPEGARRRARESMAQWSQTGFFVQHWQAMVFEPDIDLYAREGGAAYDRFMSDLTALKRSLLLNVQFIRGITYYTHGRCAAASIDSHPEVRGRRVVEARRMARRLEREGMPWTGVLAAIVRAVAENADANRPSALASLRAALQRAEAAGMAMHAAAARYRLGEALGGDEGQEIVQTALLAMTTQGIQQPARWVGIYLPGRWGPA